MEYKNGQFRLTERESAELFGRVRDLYLSRSMTSAEAWLNLLVEVLDQMGYDVVKRGAEEPGEKVDFPTSLD